MMTEKSFRAEFPEATEDAVVAGLEMFRVRAGSVIPASRNGTFGDHSPEYRRTPEMHLAEVQFAWIAYGGTGKFPQWFKNHLWWHGSARANPVDAVRRALHAGVNSTDFETPETAMAAYDRTERYWCGKRL